MRTRTIEWDEKKEVVKLIDQKALPKEYRIVECKSVEELIEAIKHLRIRGAPALGVAGAFGVVLVAMSAKSKKELEKKVEEVEKARPTAVNLSYGVKRALKAAMLAEKENIEEMKNYALKEAKRLADEDIEMNKKIGEYGAELLANGDVVLTHCNAGRLACVDHGTALGVIRTAIEKGKRIEVIACETRPANQGSRLTTWELIADKIPVTLIVDSASALVMRERKVDKVIVGADRVVKEGVINKIGTYMQAVLAKEHEIPFYVVAPTSSFDLRKSYKEVNIEERNSEELIFFGKELNAPVDAHVYNPVFDFTPFELINAVMTEKGVIYSPISPSSLT